MIHLQKWQLTGIPGGPAGPGWPGGPIRSSILPSNTPGFPVIKSSRRYYHTSRHDKCVLGIFQAGLDKLFSASNDLSYPMTDKLMETAARFNNSDPIFCRIWCQSPDCREDHSFLEVFLSLLKGIYSQGCRDISQSPINFYIFWPKFGNLQQSNLKLYMT